MRKISVIIPCYKQAKYLGEAIESVLAQTYRCFEIIVVDDGSPDDVVDITKGYSTVHYIRQNNQGVSAARNTGIRESKGEYLVLLDADDRLLPNAFEVGITCLENHPECAFASGNVSLISPDGFFLSTPEQARIERDHYLVLLQYNYIWTPGAVMFRRRVFESGFAYNISLRGSEDWDLYLRISRKFLVCCHDNVVVEYRVHGMSTSTDSGKMLKECLAVLRSQWEYAKGNKVFEEAYRRGIKGVQEYYGKPLVAQLQNHIRSHEWKNITRDVSMLFRYYPKGLVNYLFQVLCGNTICAKRDSELL